MNIAVVVPSTGLSVSSRQRLSEMKVILWRIFAKIALIFLASMPYASAHRPRDAADLVGQYQIGGSDPNYPVINLTLFQNGKFFMITDLGHDVKVRGKWRLDDRKVILSIRGRYKKKIPVFGWLLQIRSQGVAYDLVPNETVDAYREDPSNVNARFGRLTQEARKFY